MTRGDKASPEKHVLGRWIKSNSGWLDEAEALGAMWPRTCISLHTAQLGKGRLGMKKLWRGGRDVGAACSALCHSHTASLQQ
eukprot:365632-Chlamydomonas_euryale.AAC.31